MGRFGPKRGAATAPASTRIRAIARRGATRIPPAAAYLERRADREQRVNRLVAFFESARAELLPGQASPLDRLPAVEEVDQLQVELATDRASAEFVRDVIADGDLDRAVITTVKRLSAAGMHSRARSFAQAMQHYEGARAAADLGLALCALHEPILETAWTLFERAGRGRAVVWAPVEYFGFAFEHHPAEAAETLRQVIDGGLEVHWGPGVWTDVTAHSLAGGSLELTRAALERAEAKTGPDVRRRRPRLPARQAALREWLDQARSVQAGSAEAHACGQSEIPVALIGYGHPDLAARSTDIDDPTETLAALGHVLRHGVRITGRDDLIAAAEALGSGVPTRHRVDAPAATVRFVELQRDLSRWSEVPDGTWAIVSDWFAHPLSAERPDIPLDPRIRPIFVSFAISPRALAAPGVIDYLRRHAPIGCRDRETTYLLHSAGVPAFFSGALASTLDLIVPPAAPHGGETRSVPLDRLSDEIATRPLGDNLLAAAAFWRGLRDQAGEVVTGDLRAHLAARAVGCRSRYEPDDRFERRVVDYLALGDGEFEAMRRGLCDKLAAVLGAVLGGRDPDEVYAAWRSACEADVRAVEAELGSVTGSPTLTFDLDEACREIRSTAVVMERSEEHGQGAEIAVEFSMDGNYTHQFDIVLDSIVERTSRPVRAYVLCRGLDRGHFERTARLFPTVSFVWLPTDNVVYGRIPGKIKWATIATMDRTIMPVLLDDVDRIIHFDLDALCLADLGELYDVDLAGMPIAATVDAQPRYQSGFETVRRAAKLLRREGKPDEAHEFLLRMHSQHAFDFEIFNAGIMVLDLARMREDDFCGRYLAYVQRFGINGQNVLNVYAGRRRTPIDPDWNRLVRLEVVDHPRVVHWAGPFKPWQQTYVAGRELWGAQERRFAERTTAPALLG